MAEAMDSGLAEIFRTPPASGASTIESAAARGRLSSSMPLVVADATVAAAIAPLVRAMDIFFAKRRPNERAAVDSDAIKAGSSAGRANSEPRPSKPRPSGSAGSAAVSVATGPEKELAGTEPKTSGAPFSPTKTECSAASPDPSRTDSARTDNAPSAGNHAKAGGAPTTAKPPPDSSSAEQSPPDEEDEAGHEMPPPTAEQQKKLIAEIDDIYNSKCGQ